MSTEERPIVALFDMDGTLADYWGELCRQLQLLRAPQEPVLNPDDFDWETTPTYFKERMRLIKNLPGFWLGLPRWQPGFDVLEEANRIGMQIEILTKGPRQVALAWMEKLQWCQQRLCDFTHHVTITMDKGLVYGRLLVDDAPEYVLRWLQWRKRGQVIMPAHSWNKGFTHPQVYRYEGNRPEMAAVLADIVVKARAQGGPV